jgi:tRNA(Ile2) C34 agmatinyltransferase TiaS
VKLRDALLCPDCEEIHESARRCPSCGSEARAFAISRVIKPMPKETLLPLPTESEATHATAA